MSALARRHYTAKSDTVESPSRGSAWAAGARGRRTDEASDPARSDLVQVRCECGHAGCTAEIAMSLAEYRAVRRHSAQFLIKAGHEVADAVRVVGDGTEYVVVALPRPDAFATEGSLR